MKLTKLNELIEDGEVVKGRWEITPDHEVQYKTDGNINGSNLFLTACSQFYK